MIETARLTLRPHAPEDLEPWHAMFRDPDVVRFLAVRPLGREEAWHRLLRYAGHWSFLGFGMFAVLDRATGRILGETGLMDFRRGLGARFDGPPEASWIFAREAHGRGYASEALAATLAWHDARHGADRAVCIVNPDNAPSLRVAGKLGFAPFDRCTYRGAPYTMLERPAPGR